MPEEAAAPQETRIVELPEQGEMVVEHSPTDSDEPMEGTEEAEKKKIDIDSRASKFSLLLEVH